MQKHKIMTDQKIGILLVLTLKIESQLKCILKNILPRNIKFYLNRPYLKTTNYIFNLKNNKNYLKMVKRSLSSYGVDINNFSIGAIMYLIKIINFKKLVVKKYNLPINENIQFIINNLSLVCAVRNTLSHPKCKFNITENKFVRVIGQLRLSRNGNYKKIYKKLFKIKRILDQILKK